MTRGMLIVLRAMAVIAVCVAVPSSTRAASAATGRKAIVVGANHADGVVPLKYAERDALRFAGVLRELGGVDDDDVQVLLQPSAQDVLNALSSEANAQAREVLFYYSGHADADALLLGSERLPYVQLRAQVSTLPAAEDDKRVRIVVLDGCGSGGIARAKGTNAVPSFLKPSAGDVSGYAFLSSSTANEASQESDAIGASFFTHALVTGLRGAADADGDRQVTLREAYAFAYSETLQKTASSSLGPQHAMFDLHLEGRGSVVLTRLLQSTSSLLVPPEVAGHILIRDAKRRLVAEFTKTKGAAMRLALPPSLYAVQFLAESTVNVAHITLDDGEALAWADIEFNPARQVWASAKGGDYRRRVQQANRERARLDWVRDNELRVVEGKFGEPPFFAFRGNRHVAIRRSDFYHRVGRPDLEDQYLHRVWWKHSMSTGLGVVSAFGILGTIGVSLPLLLIATEEGNEDLVLPLGVGAVAVMAVGVSLFSTGSLVSLAAYFFDADPIGYEEAKQLVDEHNKTLRASSLSSSPPPRSPRRQTSSAFDWHLFASGASDVE